MYPFAQAANINGGSLDFSPVTLPALYLQRPLSWPPLLGFPGGSDDRAPARNAGDPGIKPKPLSLLHWRAGPLPLAPPGKSPSTSVLPNFGPFVDI